MQNYLVVRAMNKDDGTMETSTASFETLPLAEKEFFGLVTDAVDSEYLTDTVVLLTWDGETVDRKYFRHKKEEGVVTE